MCYMNDIQLTHIHSLIQLWLIQKAQFRVNLSFSSWSLFGCKTINGMLSTYLDVNITIRKRTG